MIKTTIIIDRQIDSMLTFTLFKPYKKPLYIYCNEQETFDQGSYPSRRSAIGFCYQNEPVTGGPCPSLLQRGKFLRDGGLGRRSARLSDALSG